MSNNEPSYLLSVVLDDATTLCSNNRQNPDFRAGVIALVAALALAEMEDEDTARWIIGLAIDETESQFSNRLRAV